jgi:hypothetical protein
MSSSIYRIGTGLIGMAMALMSAVVAKGIICDEPVGIGTSEQKTAVENRVVDLNALGIQSNVSESAPMITWLPSAEPGLIVQSQESISNGQRTWVLTIHSIGTSDHGRFILGSTGIRGVYQVISVSLNDQPIIPNIDGFTSITLGQVPRAINAECVHVELLGQIAARVANTSTTTTQTAESFTDALESIGWLNPSAIATDADGVLIYVTDENELMALFYSDMTLAGALLAPDPITLTTTIATGDENANAVAPTNPQQQAIKVYDKLFQICLTGDNSQVTINACVAWLQYCAPRPPV